jgi:hypothetical protein
MQVWVSEVGGLALEDPSSGTETTITLHATRDGAIAALCRLLDAAVLSDNSTEYNGKGWIGYGGEFVQDGEDYDQSIRWTWNVYPRTVEGVDVPVGGMA